MIRAYEDIIDFIAHGSIPAEVARFQPSARSLERVRELLALQKDGSLNDAQSRELEQTLQLEHVMRLAKAKARAYLVP